MFIKAGVASDVATTSQTVSVTIAAKIMNIIISGNNSTSSLFRSKKRFVPIYHFCNRPGHICPKYFEYQNTFKMGRFRKSNYNSRVAGHKLKNVPKHKIDLNTNHVEKI